MEDYIVEILENLININTTKSNSNEIEAAEYIKNEFLKIGVNSTIYESSTGKGSIVAKIEGQENDNIVLYSHLDTEEYMYDSGWKVRPDKSTKINGKIFGRGALDCKGLTAVWMGIIKRIINLKIKPKKTIIFVATCDEESGGEKGIKWLIDNTNYFKKTFLVISEGGGYPIKLGNTTYFTIQTGEREKIVLESNDKIVKVLQSNQDEYLLKNLKKGLITKAYNEQTVDYITEYMELENNNQRKIPIEYFNDIIIENKDDKIIIYKLPYLEDKDIFSEFNENCKIIEKVKAGDIKDLSDYLNIVQGELSKIDSKYKILPFVTPGYSDNRHFRLNGINTIGFFPIEYSNGLFGIHGANEYISTETIELSSKLLYEIIKNIAF